MNPIPTEYRRSKASRDAALKLAAVAVISAVAFGALLGWRAARAPRAGIPVLEIWLVQAAWAGVIVAVALRSWHRNVPMLRLDADGVRDVRGTFVPWHEVAAVGLERQMKVEHLVLTLHPAPPPTSIWKRSYGPKSTEPARHWLALHHLEAPPAEILAEAERWYRASGGSVATTDMRRSARA